MKRSCVLCKSRATVYCESDRASLCWSCDAKVHSANFLVARHSRSLVCEICQSETPWSSSGEKLCRSAMAICGTCDVKVVASGEEVIAEGVGGNGDEIDINRVFAWPPPAVSTSSTQDSDYSLKRKHQKVADYNFHEEEMDSSSVNYKSSSTVGDRKKLRDRNIISEENMGKSRTTVKLDLNLPAIE